MAIPVKAERLSDVVKPRKRRFTRIPVNTPTVTVEDLRVDLVQVLSDAGIVLSGVHQLARKLVERGWARTKNVIEKDIR